MKRTDRLLQQFPQTIPRTLVNFHRGDLGIESLMIAAYSRDACSITYLKKNLGIFGDKMDISQSAIKLLNRWINVIEKERENILKYEGDIGRDNLDEKLLSVAMSFDSSVNIRTVRVRGDERGPLECNEGNK